MKVKILLIGMLLAFGLASINSSAIADEGMLYPFAEDDIQLVASDYLERLQYRDYRGEDFWLSKNREDPALQLELRGIIKLSSKAFMLKFRTRDLQELPQKTYKVDHATLGPMALFCTNALNKKGTRRLYYAIINKES